VNNPSTVHRPSEVLDTLKRLNFQVAVCVPDSWLGGILEEMERDPDFLLIRATHEEEALAIACGARLTGKRTVLLIQNAGLLTMGAGMVSLAQRYEFPILVLCSYRGSTRDPIVYHIPKGRVTQPVAQGLGVRYALAEPGEAIGSQVERAALNAEEASVPFVLLLAKEDIAW
jgi:sulfopyruvate decarboxylase subunit alpha